jgi:hypothetical protein
MSTQTLLRAAFGALVGAGLLTGCGPEFDPQGRIDSLRVLAVQKDRPYAAPGDEVRLEMLWSDGSEDAGRPVEIAWVSGCHNPLGDLYAGCFADPSAELEFGSGDQFSFTVPADIITSRPPPKAPQPPYGLSYVFFAACAGNFDSASGGFPLACRDENGNTLGSNDFVAGYTAIYAYDTFRNGNPIVRGLSLDGKPLRDLCIDPGSAAAIEGGELGAVLGRAGEDTGSPSAGEPPVVCDSSVVVDRIEGPDCDDPAEICITGSPEDDPDAKEYELRPEIFRSSVEEDEISNVAYGHDYEEQMWINYYVSQGGLRSDVRLLNDATTGFNEEFPTLITPEKETGRITLWAVVHDNRGGVAWARGTAWVR